MGQQLIFLGSIPEDGTGNGLEEGGQKINDNFTENYADIAANVAAIALNTAKVTTPWTAVTGGIRYLGNVEVSGSTINASNTLMFPDAGGRDAFFTDSTGAVYESGVNSGAAPFDQVGNLIIQARSGNTLRGIYFVTAPTAGNPEVAMWVDYLKNLHVDGHIDYNTAIINLVANTTLNATHKNKIIECNGTFTVTLPDSMPTGYKVDLVNVGIGVITFAASTTLQSEGSFTKLATQYTGASAYHRGSNVWIVVGKLTA